MASAIDSLYGRAAETESYPCAGVVLYPDECARHRALQLCSKIARRFQKLFDLDFYWWKFKFLCDPILIVQAVREASKANILILSYHSGQALPDEVKAFFKFWADQRKKEPGALIGLGDPAGEGGLKDKEIGDYLQELADQAQVDLITEARFEWQSEIAQISCRAHHVTPTLEAILHQAPDPSGPVPLGP